MGFTTGNLPPVDPGTFHERPFFERIRILATQWGEYGFGTPKVVHAIYVVKLVVLYALGGIFVATATSGLGPFWHVSGWWPELVVFEKLVLWTVLLETLGLAACAPSWPRPVTDDRAGASMRGMAARGELVPLDGKTHRTRRRIGDRSQQCLGLGVGALR